MIMDKARPESVSSIEKGRRVRRTKGAIQSAFSHLVLTQDFDRIQIGDILSAADVARSTFYTHFSGKDDVLRSVLSPILDPMSRAGMALEPVHLTHVAEHLSENRRLARTILMGSARKAIVRDLTTRIEQVLLQSPGRPSTGFAASLMAQWQIACLDEWLAGRHRCDSRTWALTVHRGTRALTEALLDTGAHAEDQHEHR